MDVVNPATGRSCARSPEASKGQLNDAVAAALRAQPAWEATPLVERRACLRKLADVLRDNVDEIAALVTLEQGRPIARARDEVTRSAALLEAVIAIDIGNEILRDDSRGRVVVHHRALGVIGAIAPWNVPIGLAVPKITHALYTGNTIVLKPSPYTPLATLRLGQLARDIFPAGVLNILSGGNEIGALMSAHPDVAKISITGSVATGKRVMASAAGTLKRLTLELGGNDAAIVRADADIDRIAPQLFAAAFVNSGQVCMAIKRLYVHASLHDQLCAALTALARQAIVGDGFNESVQLGPVQNAVQFESVERVLAETRAQPGASILAGGRAMTRDGYFIQPTIVAGLHEGAALVDEETFGPVLPVLSFETDDEAVARANAGKLGLAASVWTADLHQAERLARRLVAGTVWINRHVGVDPEVPFGGAKESGIGQQFGRAGLLDCMQSTAVYVPAG
ncbi:MAG: aldehyde dehydrogenase family protein [Burkholderiales bacterium]|nr:MAG: aldehyde dehydrogenase family protein [Burkholderiales bacterium]